MRKALSEGRWDGGKTTLFVTTTANGDLEYELKSEFDEHIEKRTPPSVSFTPAELRELIQKTRSELSRSGLPDDAFSTGDFQAFVDWFDQNGDAVIAEVESEDGVTKKFRVKKNNDSRGVFLKVQRETSNGGYLRDSPTLDRDEFEGVFAPLTVL